SSSGAVAIADLRGGLGLRLRSLVELARGLRRLPAPQDRGRRRVAPAAHDARRRLRAARGVTVALRGRLMLMSSLIVGVILVLGSCVAYAAVRNQQIGQIEDALRGNVAFYQRVAARFSGEPPPGRPENAPPPSLGGPGAYVQLVRPTGEV